MECAGCGVDKLDRAWFCANCTFALSQFAKTKIIKCLECGSENPNDNRFCNWCGLQIVAPSERFLKEQGHPQRM